ncbi:MAG: hypothetical protein SYNGOMJ08_00671 [Candidatus Syntrophoarchaeum sp. GoM_oil]|nr:MAG: hypothetical protein SYNGOMJ08_00671 [Candidatus Syntrophoarchaeum sp. GoM_oil]
MREESKDLEWASQSLVEELQAINAYQERIEATLNEGLKKLLEHNRDEEKEHVAMLIEWIRANDNTQDRMFEEHD